MCKKLEKKKKKDLYLPGFFFFSLLNALCIDSSLNAVFQGFSKCFLVTTPVLFYRLRKLRQQVVRMHVT